MDVPALESERRFFEAALLLEGDSRERFLREIRARDTELEARIRALLAAHDRPELSPAALQSPALASAILEAPALETPAPRPSEPQRVGPYRLLERVGEGGMGVVYVAEQTEPVRRRVALKLIKGVTYSREQLGRFHSERQALALMNHPNIARILDAGSTEDGRPFFVMEYVRGALLLDYCDRHELSIDQRVELFIQVCEAVQHAHQKGVIHRDLKPSNLLVEEVDGKATPKVIDFGVAKMLYQRLSDVTLHTRLGGFIGTPGYVSPEQAQTTGLDVDTRTDVYSLGAVLYELLTGRKPFDFRGADLGEIQHILANRDPKPPSARSRQNDPQAHEPEAHDRQRRQAGADGRFRSLREDLDWITLKALEKDRSERYAAASELAADLRRYLEHETVLARPPSTTYQLRLLARRHALLLAVGTLAILALVTGTVGTWLGMVRARDAAERAEVNAAIAEEVNGFLNDDLLAAVAPGQMGIDVSMREVLDRAAQRVEGRFPNQPLVEAALRRTIGRTYGSLGVFTDAEQHLLRSLELFNRERGAEASSTRALHFELGTLYRAQGRLGDAELALERARATEGVPRDALQRGRLDELSLAALEELAIIRHQSGRFEEAEALYLQALDGRTALLGREHPDTMRVLGRLAIAYRYLERWPEAERIHREAVAVNQVHFGEEHPRTLNAISRFAAFYLGWGRNEEAEGLLQRALAPSRRVLGEEHPNTLILVNNLGWLYLKQGRYGESEQLLLENLRVKRRVLGELHPSTVEGLQNLVILYREMAAEHQHAKYLRRFAETLEKVCDGPEARTEDRLEYAEVLLTAEVTELRDPDRALSLALAAVEATDRQDREALAVLARAYEAVGNPERAVDVAREALQLSTEGSEVHTRLQQLLVSLKREPPRRPLHDESI
ncbi:MAG: serine/threonine-protein kinase [Acidobacteriota bacterium]